MKAPLQLNLTLNNCEISEMSHFRIIDELEFLLLRFPNHSTVDLTLSKNEKHHWTFDLSMKHSRGHVAVVTSEKTLDQVITSGLLKFKKNLQIHELQAAIEAFHFDKAGEYDYYTEVSNGTLAMPKRKLSTLLVEDDPASAVVLTATLNALGCSVDYFSMPDTALSAILTKRYDLLVLDWNLPYMKGGEFLVAADRLLQKADRSGVPPRQVPVVICTSMPIEEINLPAVSHFCFYNHWHKSLPFSSVLGSLDETTKKITVRNHIAS